MAEFWRALRTLKALQAQQAIETGPVLTTRPLEVHPEAPAAPPPLVHGPRPNEPERHAGPPLEYAMPEPSAPGRILQVPTASWLPNEPEPGRDRQGGRGGPPQLRPLLIEAGQEHHQEADRRQ